MTLSQTLNELSEFYDTVELDLFTHELTDRGINTLGAYEWLRDMTIADYSRLNQEPDILFYITEYITKYGKKPI